MEENPFPPPAPIFEKIFEFRTRSRMEDPDADITPELIEEMAKEELGARELVKGARKRELLEADVEVDPDLLEVGDEVAEEVVTEFKRASKWGGQSVLVETDSSTQSSRSRHSPEEQRAAAQRVADLMFEQDWHKGRALEVVAAEMGVSKTAVDDWVEKAGIELPRRAKQHSQVAWGLNKRLDLFERQMSFSALLLDRAMVWLQWKPGDPVEQRPPEDWNAANELKTIAIASAVAHDKITNIEDLKAMRGLRDVDSEELQNELASGKQRLLEMGGNEFPD